MSHTERRGKNVTIAFLDSGFYPHPDLTRRVNRIVAFEDVTRLGASLKQGKPKDADWHGTQTAVTACGNGRLSGGVWPPEIRTPGAGRYRYKIVVGRDQWIDDPANPSVTLTFLRLGKVKVWDAVFYIGGHLNQWRRGQFFASRASRGSLCWSNTAGSGRRPSCWRVCIKP